MATLAANVPHGERDPMDIHTATAAKRGWPLHPDTLKYLVVASGFQRVEMRFLSPYPGDAKLQHCQVPPEVNAPGIVNLAQAFNENVDKINALMFSYLDYAVVARRL